jgi:hypothetical protein
MEQFMRVWSRFRWITRHPYVDVLETCVKSSIHKHTHEKGMLQKTVNFYGDSMMFIMVLGDGNVYRWVV